MNSSSYEYSHWLALDFLLPTYYFRLGLGDQITKSSPQLAEICFRRKGSCHNCGYAKIERPIMYLLWSQRLRFAILARRFRSVLRGRRRDLPPVGRNIEARLLINNRHVIWVSSLKLCLFCAGKSYEIRWSDESNWVVARKERAEDHPDLGGLLAACKFQHGCMLCSTSFPVSLLRICQSAIQAC